MSSPRIEVHGLTKRFGPVTAVNELSFTANAGTVTGFLGPNGAGKTTTLRVVLGLVTATEGTALVNGMRYRDLPHPTRVVGAMLESSGFHPARTARNHLRVIATASGIAESRIEEVLGFVGLAEVASRAVGGFSLGMRQRLELARALLGDPEILVLDEPASGLDPQGIAWLRSFLRRFAASGKVVLVSSHLLAEAAQTIDHVIVLSSGRLVGEGALSDLLAGASQAVRVRSTDPEALLRTLTAAGIAARREPPDAVVAAGVSPEAVGRAMAAAGTVVLEMSASGETLEELFFSMTEPSPEGPAAGWNHLGAVPGPPRQAASGTPRAPA